MSAGAYDPQYFEYFFQMCGWPEPSNSDLLAWSALDGGSAATKIYPGLFGYDITCLQHMCSFGAGDRDGYCPALQAKGIDGLTFGAKWEVDKASTSFYCVGFHDEERSDTWVCADYGSDYPESYYCADNYSVTSNYFAVGAVHECRNSGSAYYGLGD